MLARVRKYPRVRGEEDEYPLWIFDCPEIPPRARGRALDGLVDVAKSGKYPRACREEACVRVNAACVLEIPPRARGRATHPRHIQPIHRNTPACAGKRPQIRLAHSCQRKYPRVRGEELTILKSIHYPLEIPPRARGRGSPYPWQRVGNGNTPACAGKRHTCRAIRRRYRKYPRVRGEEAPVARLSSSKPEIPPRARGRGGDDA